MPHNARRRVIAAAIMKDRITTAIPGQYFNDINHVVEMIRQKHDVACAEYRLECP